MRRSCGVHAQAQSDSQAATHECSYNEAPKVQENIAAGVTVSDIRRDRISGTQPNATNACAVMPPLRSLLGRDELLHPLKVKKFTYA